MADADADDSAPAPASSPSRWCEACPWQGKWCPGINQRTRCGGIAGGTGDPGPIVVTTPHAPPLAGDLVQALAAKIGADRAAKWVAEKLGVDCGCSARQEAINRLDAKLRKFLGR